MMTKVPVAGLADLNGLRIGVAGPSINWLDGTGAVGVSGNLTTYYTSPKSGLLDGAIVPASAAFPTKFYEVAPEIKFVGFGAQYAGNLAANSDWYAAQPSEVQVALKSAAVTYSAAYADELQATLDLQLDLMVAAGAGCAPDHIRPGGSRRLPFGTQGTWRNTFAKLGPKLIAASGYTRVLHWISLGVLVGSVLLVNAEIIARNVFGHPLVGMPEVMGQAIVVFAFFNYPTASLGVGFCEMKPRGAHCHPRSAMRCR